MACGVGRPDPRIERDQGAGPAVQPLMLLNELVTEGKLGADGQLGIGLVRVQPPMLLNVELVGGPILAPSLRVVHDIEEVMKKKSF